MSKTYEMIRLDEADYIVWDGAEKIPSKLLFDEVRELLVQHPQIDETHRYIVDIRRLPPDVVAHLQTALLSGQAARDSHEPSLMEVDRTLFDALVELIRALVEKVLSLLTGKGHGRSPGELGPAAGVRRQLRIEHDDNYGR
ncbi:hypothetical protein [Stutzerimonas zhaodongensis]|uniref:hypothetical protein n=1 Tax=Stutzerimonas zhaodongensis TaxID=1176257 RepID=UPI0021074035|nr:hypothetical protein [Stutzerimonas zhaodongensis]MCQ2032239.1 hypothetical protein [Stutzerimonas zhaodongensis]